MCALCNQVDLDVFLTAQREPVLLQSGPTENVEAFKADSHDVTEEIQKNPATTIMPGNQTRV